MLPTIVFRNIRGHDGSNDRGFEELCYQLMPWLETFPAGLDLARHGRRHGTPDGGVEFLVNLEDGSVWGWQAKYLFALGSGEFSQMDKSVEAALDSQPQLRRYTFCLPCNRPAGDGTKVKGTTNRKIKSAMQRWDEHCEKWRAWAADRGMDVEFRYVGESELLTALTVPANAGRIYYWFNTTFLTPDGSTPRNRGHAATASGGG